MTSPDSRLRQLLWLAGAMAIVTCGYALVVARNPGFFLVDDTESAILPMFSHLGHELRDGVWPGITERNWTVGLVAADPQYAVFNPVSLFTYWVVEPLDSLVWRLLVIVLFWVNLLVVGVFWAARALGSSAPFAALAGVIAGLNVFILYWQAAGWTTLLPGVTWYTLGVAALIAAVERPDRPWRAVVAGLLTAMVVTSGSPFALVAFVVTAVVLGAWTLVDRNLDRVRRHVLTIAATTSGAVLGAAPWLVSLAYIPYTRRQGGTYNTGFLTLHLESLLLSFSPSIRPFTGSFQAWGYLDQPVTYGSWLFAGAAAVAIVRRVRLDRTQWAVLVAGLALFAVTMGPERLGPIRWPFRFVPFALILLTITTVVVIERGALALPRPRPRHRYGLGLAGVTLVAAVASFMIHASVLAGLVTALVLGAGVPFVVWCVRSGRSFVLVGGGLAVTGVVWAAIVIASPKTTDLVDLGSPGVIAAARDDLRPLSGHRTLQLIGPMPAGLPSVLGHLYPLYGTEPAEVVNGYTSLVPLGLGRLLCLQDPGYTCTEAAARIFEREPETGMRYIDLFGASQIMVQRGPLLDAFEQARSPEWVPTAESPWWVMYGNGTRLGESPIVWASDGASADGEDRVAVPAGGQVVLSRPLWPGTEVSVGGVRAELDPVSDVFVRATFDEDASGELRVNQRVPGAWSAIAATVVGALGLLACAVVAAKRRFVRRLPA